MDPNHENREHKTIVDLLKTPFTKKKRSPRKEKVKFDDSSRIHKLCKDLASNLASKKREKIQDDGHRLQIKKPALKEGKKIDDHKPSKGLSGSKRKIQEIPTFIKKSAFKKEKKIDDDKPSKDLSGNKRKIQETPTLIKKSAFMEEKKIDDRKPSKGFSGNKRKIQETPTLIKKSALKEEKKESLSRDMQPVKTQQQGVSTKIKIRDDHNSRKPPRNVDQDASPRRTRVETTTPLVQKPRTRRRLVKKLPTKDAAECKHSDSVGALISMEEYLKNSTEKILLQGEGDDDCESWKCKPLSEFVIPGPIPDFDALGFGDIDAIDFSQYFVDDED